MKLVVGLGNPGRRYDETRHNIGFLVIDRLVRKYGLTACRSRVNAEIAEGDIAGVPVLTAKPLAYMNRSGDPVSNTRALSRPVDLGTFAAATLVTPSSLLLVPGFMIQKTDWRLLLRMGLVGGLVRIYQGFQKRVAGKSVGTMQAGTGGLPHGIQSADIGLAA